MKYLWICGAARGCPYHRLLPHQPPTDEAGEDGPEVPTGWPALGLKSLRPLCGRSCRPAVSAPARPRTGSTWLQFLRSQAEAILACDFFTVELLDGTQADFWHPTGWRHGFGPARQRRPGHAE
jgi:hypothetical protein